MSGPRAARRSVLPRSRVGLHQPSGGGQEKLPDLALQAPGIVRPRTEMEQVLARHTGQRVEKLREDAERGLVLSAEEAVAYGLADAVLGSRKPSTLLA